MSSNLGKTYLYVFLICGLLTVGANGQTTLDVDSTSFKGALHDNLSNKKRQGSGFTPLIFKSYPGANLFRNDAVGINFEHIFNGAKEQNGISMFTPRHDPCHLKQVGESRFQIHWPNKGSKWGMEARMVYDLSKEGYVDLVFECKPTRDLYSQGFVAMMWASYMNRTLDRKIHFWGKEGDRTGWVEFGEGKGKDFEVGTVSHAAVANLPSEKGAKTLNLIEHPGEGNIEAVKQHIAAGTDVDAKAGSIVTPLHVATVFGNKGIPELLIAKGVDVNAKMEDGRTPLNLAESKEHKEPADLLCKHGGKTGVELKAQGK